ncbi:DTW domain-containing protein 1 [Mactra antiquata]
MEKNPFPDLLIDSSEFLECISGRQKCPKCMKSRKYYCYTCYLPVPEVADKVPYLKLPIKIDVIKHPSEVDGKSTAVHAAVIAPDDVTVYTYPCIPDYDNKEKVVLVFPGETSLTLKELAKKIGKIPDTEQNCLKRKFDDIVNDNEIHQNKITKFTDTNSIQDAKHDKTSSVGLKPGSKEKVISDINESLTNADDCVSGKNLDNCKPGIHTNDESTKVDNAFEQEQYKIDRVIFIDSTWNQSKTIYNDERLKGLQCVELKTQETKFWRSQRDIPNTYLSTIEAMYYFLTEFHEQFISSVYQGEYDNLLFFFKFMYGKIRTLYDGGDNLKAYKDRKK